MLSTAECNIAMTAPITTSSVRILNGIWKKEEQEQVENIES